MDLLKRCLLLTGLFFVPLVMCPHPGGAQVRVGVHIGPPPSYRFSAPPPVVVIPGTYVYMIPDIDTDVFFFSGYWFRSYGGHWFRAGPTTGRGHTGPITGFPEPFWNYHLTIAGCRPDTGGYPRRSSKEVGQDGHVTGTGTETANGGRVGTKNPEKDVMKGAALKEGLKTEDPGASKEDPVRTAVGAWGPTITTVAETNHRRHDRTHEPSGAEEVRMKKQGKSLVVAVYSERSDCGVIMLPERRGPSGAGRQENRKGD